MDIGNSVPAGVHDGSGDPANARPCNKWHGAGLFCKQNHLFENNSLPIENCLANLWETWSRPSRLLGIVTHFESCPGQLRARSRSSIAPFCFFSFFTSASTAFSAHFSSSSPKKNHVRYLVWVESLHPNLAFQMLILEWLIFSRSSFEFLLENLRIEMMSYLASTPKASSRLAMWRKTGCLNHSWFAPRLPIFLTFVVCKNSKTLQHKRKQQTWDNKEFLQLDTDDAKCDWTKTNGNRLILGKKRQNLILLLFQKRAKMAENVRIEWRQ